LISGSGSSLGISRLNCISCEVGYGFEFRVQLGKRGHGQVAKFVEVVSLSKRRLQAAEEGFKNFFARLLAVEKAVGEKRRLRGQIHFGGTEVFLAFVKPYADFF
jgi:hypothetical protein